jgi:hypothetical protein
MEVEEIWSCVLEAGTDDFSLMSTASEKLNAGFEQQILDASARRRFPAHKSDDGVLEVFVDWRKKIIGGLVDQVHLNVFSVHGI